MYLTDVIVIVHCTRSQANRCDAVSMTGLFGKRSCLDMPAKGLPDHCGACFYDLYAWPQYMALHIE